MVTRRVIAGLLLSLLLPVLLPAQRGAPELPVTSGLILRVKASSLALADGTAVSTWPDLSGAGNNLTQTIGAAQPVYKAASPLTGRPIVWFGATPSFLSYDGQWMVIPPGVSVAANSCTVLVISEAANMHLATVPVTNGDKGMTLYRQNLGASFIGNALGSPSFAGLEYEPLGPNVTGFSLGASEMLMNGARSVTSAGLGSTIYTAGAVGSFTTGSSTF